MPAIMESSFTRQPVIFRDLGLIGYQEAWDYQEYLLQQNVKVKAAAYATASGQGSTCDERSREAPWDTLHHLLLCEHAPVFTLGKSGQMAHLLVNEKQLAEKGISFYRTNRGGDITFHGPEQIVGYPILDLEKFFRDIGRYLRSLEEVIIRTIAEYGIRGERSPGETGVWIAPQDAHKARKICAMGVRCSRWITMHGFALNVNTDLSYFDHIIPCGIQGKQVTSIERELGHTVSIEEVKEKLKHHFEEVFRVDLRDASL